MIANEAVTVAEHEREAESPEEQAAQTSVDDAHSSRTFTVSREAAENRPRP